MFVYTGSAWVAAYVSGTGFAALSGATFTGNVTVPNLTVSGNVDGRDVSVDGTKLDGIEASADVTDETNVAAAGALMTAGGTMSGDLNFGDNDKAVFGAGNDLQIYHDASESIIEDVGNGDLKVRGSDEVKIQVRNAANTAWLNAVVAADAGAVTLSHNNAAKLATTASGINVTGTINSTHLQLGASGSAVYFEDTNYAIKGSANNGYLQFHTGGAERMRIDNNGRVGIGTATPSSYGELAVYKASGNVEAAVVTGGANYATYRLQNNARRYSMQIRTDQSNAFVIRDETASANRFVVDTSGNVGIGTTATSGAKLKVDGGATAGTVIQAGNAQGGVILGAESSTAYVNTTSSTPLAFEINNSEHMRVDAGGKLNVNNTTGSARVNISADNWPENALALYSAGIAGQTNFAGMGFFNQDADSPIGQVADIYTNPTGTLSLTASGNPAIQLKYGSHGISGGTPALTVDNAGRIGIGVTTPSSGVQLDVRGTGVLQLVNTDNVQLIASNGGSTLKNVSNNPLIFGTNNTERMRIDSSGQVTINKTVVAGSQTAGSITGSQTPDMSTYQNFVWTLTGNITLANPTTEKVGQTGFFVFIHSGGARTVSLGTQYRTPGGAGLTLSSTTGAVDFVPYAVRAVGIINLGTPQLAFS